MITLSIIVTFASQLMDFIQDIVRFFKHFFSNIHTILNRVMPDEILIVFLIAFVAFLAILLFRMVINKR